MQLDAERACDTPLEVDTPKPYDTISTACSGVANTGKPALAANTRLTAIARETLAMKGVWLAADEAVEI